MTEPRTPPAPMTPPDLIDTLMPRLVARARRLTGNPEEAEDLAQETALRLLQLQKDEADIDAPDRYAMVMLHNLVRARWRRQRPTEELSEGLLQTPPAAPARLACAELRSAIARLPRNQARLMVLVMQGESSPQALAERLRLPPGTVMSRLARARAALRRDMGLTRKASVVELM